MSSEPTAALGPDTTNFQKYQTGNPLMQGVIRRFLTTICGHVQAIKPQRIIDLGCGEGIVAHELAQLGLDFQYRGMDLNPESVEAAKALNAGNAALQFETADIIATEPQEDWADVALCLEVLEHLPEPREAIRQIMRWSRGKAILSVPWEPWFRMGNFVRGRHITRLGNHPEHIQQFRPRTFGKLLREFSPNVRITTCFPWIIAIVDTR